MVQVRATENVIKPLRKKNLQLLACLLGGLLLAAAVITSHAVDLIQLVATSVMKVKNDTALMQVLTSNLESVDIAVTLFSITNGDRFLSGEDHKLRVEEVGPFVYRENRTNEDIVLDEESGTIQYTPGFKSTFVLEDSMGRPNQINVTMPDLAMLGIASFLSSANFLLWTPFNLLTHQLRSRPLVTLDAESYITGYENPLVTLGHATLPGVVSFSKLGILSMIYKESPNRLKVATADDEKFKIRTRNGDSKLLMKPGQSDDTCDMCDSFNNTYEGFILPSPMTPDIPLNVYRTGLCKILDMEYQETKKVGDADGLVFKLKDSFFSLNKSEPNDGLLDLSDCFYGLPAFLSKINFLDTNPKSFERIEGLLKPNPAHNTIIVIEPMFGLAVDIYVPIQINLVTSDLGFNSAAKAFSNMVIPIAYLEIKQRPLNDEVKSVFHIFYVTLPICMRVFQIVGALLSLLLLWYSFTIVQKNRSSLLVLSTMKDFEKEIPVVEPLMEKS